MASRLADTAAAPTLSATLTPDVVLPSCKCCLHCILPVAIETPCTVALPSHITSRSEDSRVVAVADLVWLYRQITSGKTLTVLGFRYNPPLEYPDCALCESSVPGGGV